MQVTKRMMVALCPDCEDEIELSPSTRPGQKLECPNCWSRLEVVSVEPLELSWDSGELDDAWDAWDDEDLQGDEDPDY
jgi:lysine biosynthesis protein LysW